MCLRNVKEDTGLNESRKERVVEVCGDQAMKGLSNHCKDLTFIPSGVGN